MTGGGDLESRWVRVDGTRVHARVSTAAPAMAAHPVVLVHGMTVSSRYMVPTARCLAPHVRVYAPDLPGHGLSDKPDHALDVSEAADVLAAWMDATGLDRASLLGNSYGCQIAVEFAVRHPDRLDRAILQGPTTDPAARSTPRLLWRWLVNAPREPPGLALILLKDYRDAGGRRALQGFRRMRGDPIERKLPRVHAPTLVVRGSRDPIVPDRWVREVVDRLPRGRLVTIPGAAHTINYTAPLELARVTLAFLASDPDPEKSP